MNFENKETLAELLEAQEALEKLHKHTTKTLIKISRRQTIPRAHNAALTVVLKPIVGISEGDLESLSTIENTVKRLLLAVKQEYKTEWAKCMKSMGVDVDNDDD